MLFISRVWGRPWLACHLSPARKFPNIARTNQNSFQNCGNWIPFLENLSVLFFDGPRVIKGGSWLNWCKVRPRPCQSERIVPIWGVVRKSKCQPGRKSGVSERRNPFLGFEQIRGAAPNTKVGAGGGEIGGNVGERGLLWRSCWFVQDPLFCKLARCPLVRPSLFLCALRLKLWSSKFSMGRNSHFASLELFSWCRDEQSIQRASKSILKIWRKKRFCKKRFRKKVYQRAEGDDPDLRVACIRNHCPGNSNIRAITTTIIIIPTTITIIITIIIIMVSI